jgi:hypothetical protein
VVTDKKACCSKESPSWERKRLAALLVEVRMEDETVMHRMESKNSAVTSVIDKVVRTLHQMDIQKSVVKR